MPFRRTSYVLTPPSWPVFIGAAILAALSALVHYRVLVMPALNGLTYEMMLGAAILLIAGALLRGV